ncbi:MAG: hypothetical protein ABSG31_12755, partial [Tepidisphaeraceae bacterium]
CIGRLRSRLSAKLLRIPPPQAGYFSLSVPLKMPPRTSPGKPVGFAATTHFRMRANAASSARWMLPKQIFSRAV